MSYSVIPTLCESLKRRLDKLSQGDYGVEETVRVFEVLHRFEEELNNTVFLDRRTRRATDYERLGGVSTPTIIREEPSKSALIDTWDFDKLRPRRL